MITVDTVRDIARDLPRSYEVVVHDRIKFRVGKIVWLAFSRDELTMGVAFPKEEREAMIAAEPDKFLLPRPLICASTGSRSASQRSMRPSCSSSSSKPGAWSCPSEWRPPSWTEAPNVRGRRGKTRLATATSRRRCAPSWASAGIHERAASWRLSELGDGAARQG